MGREGFRGLKIWVSLRASDPRMFVVVEAAQQQGWPVFFHSYYRTHGAPCPSETPPMELAALARKHPRAQFIMAHMGAQFEHGLNAVAACPNMAVDYAGSINEKGAYETALRLLGPDRVVVGTPTFPPASTRTPAASSNSTPPMPLSRRYSPATFCES